jgi:hypothetical protein
MRNDSGARQVKVGRRRCSRRTAGLVAAAMQQTVSPGVLGGAGHPAASSRLQRRGLRALDGSCGGPPFDAVLRQCCAMSRLAANLRNAWCPAVSISFNGSCSSAENKRPASTKVIHPTCPGLNCCSALERAGSVLPSGECQSQFPVLMAFRTAFSTTPK